jgi:doubled CXXCH domain
LTGGLLYLLFLAVAPVFADGGPHELVNNSGSAGLTGDCAACHRAHTAQAESLLKAALPGLCLNCHNGTGATTDVVDGYQLVPSSWTHTPATDNVLGALRGGGFSYALIDSGHAARLAYGGSQTIRFTASVDAGTWDLTIDGHTATGLSRSITASALQTLLNAGGWLGTSTTYTSACSATTCPTSGSSAPTTNNATVKLATASGVNTYTVTYQNEERLVAHTISAIPTVSDPLRASGVTVTITTADTTAARFTGFVGVLARADKEAVTSKHTNDGALGTVWGNGLPGVGVTYVGPVVETTSDKVGLNCAQCHNPHGNGQYRVLQVTPGENFDPTTGFVGLGRDVEVKDVGDPSTTKNYTVKSGAQATDVTGTATAGDYFRKRYDPTGVANWTNYYLNADQMNGGWDGTKFVNAKENGDVAPPNTNGLMTAWCVACHTRYSTATGTSNLSNGAGANADTGDPIFRYRHSTSSSVGCEQCHVSHGSNAVMQPGTASANVAWPGGSVGNDDSRLLKVDNRGTCNLCHDPTGTIDPGDTTGTIPDAVIPGY